MEIKPIRKLQNLRIKVYNPDGSYIGTIKDEIQLMDFQLQIKRAAAEGYYITYKSRQYPIEKTGRIHGFYPDEEVTINKQLMELVGF